MISVPLSFLACVIIWRVVRSFETAGIDVTYVFFWLSVFYQRWSFGRFGFIGFRLDSNREKDVRSRWFGRSLAYDLV